jgi:hypothetical protein
MITVQIEDPKKRDRAIALAMAKQAIKSKIPGVQAWGVYVLIEADLVA